MSKSFALAGLWLVWIVWPHALLQAVATHRDYTTISVALIDDAFAVVALASREVILIRLRAITCESLSVLGDWVRSHADVSYVKPQSSTTALIHYDVDIGSYDFCTQLLEDAGVMFILGDAFDICRAFRIGFTYDTKTRRTGLALPGELLDTP